MASASHGKICDELGYGPDVGSRYRGRVIRCVVSGLLRARIFRANAAVRSLPIGHALIRKSRKWSQSATDKEITVSSSVDACSRTRQSLCAMPDDILTKASDYRLQGRSTGLGQVTIARGRLSRWCSQAKWTLDAIRVSISRSRTPCQTIS